MNWIENHFVPFAAKLGSQRHLAAIRDGFVAFMPLMIAGAFAVLLNNFVLGGAPVEGEAITFGLYQFFQDSSIGEWILKLKDIQRPGLKKCLAFLPWKVGISFEGKLSFIKYELLFKINNHLDITFKIIRYYFTAKINAIV